MRQDNANFYERNKAEDREPRFVVRVEFATNDSVYLCSHDVTGLTGDNVYEDALVNLSGISQKLDPKKANSEIGSFNFEVLDDGLTDVTRTKLRQEGKGLKGKTVEAYVGAADLDWPDYILVTTQIIEQASFSDRKYSVECSDIQRRMREDIFEIRETALASTLEPDATTVSVFSTTGFKRRYQPSVSGADAPGQTVGYLRVEENDEVEIIRYTGETDTAFTGCTRGVLGTQPIRVEKDSNTDADNAPKVEEYVYLEMPAPMMAYAILTGALLGVAGETLPAHWHLGIDPKFVRTSDYENIGTDLFDPNDFSRGLIARFEDMDKEDGKQFVEEQLYRMMGCYGPISSDGQIGLERMTGVLSDAGYVRELNEDNVVSYGDLTHVMEDVINLMAIHWNYVPRREDFTRTNILQDPDSIERHGQAELYEIEFRGLHGSRHSYETIKNVLDSLRDRYAGPPLSLSLTLTPDQNDLEVGDVVRVDLENIQDFTGETRDGHLFRNFEIQKASTDWKTGEVKADLFGSSQKASDVPPEEFGSALSDSFYSSEGTEINGTNFANVSSSGGITTITGDITLSGGSSMTDAGAIFWCGEDLTIDDGVTVTMSGNVQLRVAGFFQINGTINGVGGGQLGGAGLDPSGDITYNLNSDRQAYEILSYEWSSSNLGGSGFLDAQVMPGLGVAAIGRGDVIYHGLVKHLGQDMASSGKYTSFPQVAVEVESDALTGLPADLRGAGGPGGGPLLYEYESYPKLRSEVAGGDGGNGGAGLIVVSRGSSIGAAGLIDLSGADGAAGGQFSDPFTPGIFQTESGSGAGGGPGAVLFLVDGSNANPPTLTGDLLKASIGSLTINGRILIDYQFRGTVVTEHYELKYPNRSGLSTGAGGIPNGSDLLPAGYKKIGGGTPAVNAWQAASRVKILTGEIAPSPDVPQDTDPATSITLQELTNTPESAKANLSTIEVSVTAPSADNYSHSLVEYRVQGKDGWSEVGPTAPEATFVVTSDGTTYEVRARPVSTSGKVGPSGPVGTITTTDMVNNPDPGDVDNVAPLDPVTGLQVENGGTEFTGRDCKVVWTDPNRTDLNELEYKVEILDGATVVRTETVSVPHYVYTSEKNAEDYAAQNATPGRWRAFDVRVRVVGYVQTSSGQQESSTTSISVSNPAPALPNALNISAAFRMIEIDFEQPSDLDYKELKVWISQTSGFVRDGSTLKATKAGGPINIEGLTSGTTYYLRVATYDDFGEGSVSSEFTVTTERLSANDITDALVPSYAGRAMRGNSAGDQFIPVADVAVAGGTANAITADVGLDAYNANQVITLKATATNTGAVTLELDSLGVVDVKLPDGSDLPAGIIMTDRLFRVWYDTNASVFVLLQDRPIATQADAEAGTSPARLMTPERTTQHFDEHIHDYIYIADLDIANTTTQSGSYSFDVSQDSDIDLQMDNDINHPGGVSLYYVEFSASSGDLPPNAWYVGGSGGSQNFPLFEGATNLSGSGSGTCTMYLAAVIRNHGAAISNISVEPASDAFSVNNPDGERPKVTGFGNDGSNTLFLDEESVSAEGGLNAGVLNPGAHKCKKAGGSSSKPTRLSINGKIFTS